MEKIILKTDLSCKHCVMKVEPILKAAAGIVDYSIDLQHPDRLLTLSSERADVETLITGFKKAGYSAEKLIS